MAFYETVGETRVIITMYAPVKSIGGINFNFFWMIEILMLVIFGIIYVLIYYYTKIIEAK